MSSVVRQKKNKGNSKTKIGLKKTKAFISILIILPYTLFHHNNRKTRHNLNQLTRKNIQALKKDKIFYLMFRINDEIQKPTSSFTDPKEISKKIEQEYKSRRTHPKISAFKSSYQISEENAEALKFAGMLPQKYQKEDDEELDNLAFQGMNFMRQLLTKFEIPFSKFKNYLNLAYQKALLTFVKLGF